MLVFERVQNGNTTQYEVRLKDDQLRAFLTDLAPSLTRGPRNARFTFNDDTHKLELIQPASIGRDIDVDKSIETIQEKLYAGEHTIPLVMTYTIPR